MIFGSLMEASNCKGSVRVTEAVAIHPKASAAFTVYVRANKPDAEAFVPPPGVHKYVYGFTPPLAVAVAIPSFPLKQLTFLTEEMLTEVVVGWVMLTVLLAVHWLLSVTVMLYVPTLNPVIVAVV